MRISIFGLGYVGAVTAACLARDGHQILGVDVNPEKVALIAKGESPIVEPGLSDLLREQAAFGNLRASCDVQDAVVSTDLSLICVGTPPDASGAPDLGHVYQVVREIGAAIKEKSAPHTVVLRSTVPPGTLETCRQHLDAMALGVPVHLAFNPEFLRESSAIKDYEFPPYTIIGTHDMPAEQNLREMYAKVYAPFHVTAPEVAEMVKYTANAWHATKIVFANEVARVAGALGVDGLEVMRLMTQDSKLNISAAYLKPGFAYGGSCLPKDLGALLALAKNHDVSIPMLRAVPESNRSHIDLVAEDVIRRGIRRVAVLGLAFKAGTDDLRESPTVKLVKRLIGEGCLVRIFDREVQQARIMGTNLAYIQKNLPHFENLLEVNLDAAIADADVVIVTYPSEEFRAAVKQLDSGTLVMDLVHLSGSRVLEGDVLASAR